MHHGLIASYANPLIVADAADFDGTNDRLARGADLSGNADSKSGIISAWIRLDGSDAATQRVLCGLITAGAPQTACLLERTPANIFEITMRNAAVADILRMSTAGTYTAGATWRHLLAAWDLATVGARSLYMNDVSDLTVTTFTDDTIDYTQADYVVGGAQNLAAFLLNGCLAELYFAPGQYLDFSLVSNRRKFISASGKPVHLGVDGSLPTGTAPKLYMHLDDGEAVGNLVTNRGAGGNFTFVGIGSLSAASTSPSD